MLKKLSFLTIIFFILNYNQSIAFHQNGNSKEKILIDNNINKKDVQAEYCVSELNQTKELIETVEKELVNDEEVYVPKTIEQKYFVIESFHLKKSEKAPKNLDFSILKSKINGNSYIGEDKTTIENLLSFYCIQEEPKEDNLKEFKLKSSSISNLYDEIAQINNLKDRNELIKGKIFDEGKINLSLENKKLIYSKAQFIHDAEVKKANIAEEERIKKAEKEAREKEEKDFIASVKPKLVEEITNKKLDFEEEIKKINDKFTKLKIKFENFEKYFKEKTIETEDLLDLVDVSQKEIKNKAIELKKFKRQYLNSIIIDDLKSKYKKLSIIKTSDFKNYENLEDLLKDIDKRGDEKICFEEGEGRRGCSPSFPLQWSRIKNDKLGSDTHENNIDNLTEDIDKAKLDIETNIISLNEEIRILEQELGNQFPWNYIIIGIVVFFAVIGFGLYVYFNNKRIKEIQEDADRTVSTLKTNLEGRLQNTAAELRSVKNATNFSNANVQKADIQSTPAKIEKTQEQIIIEQFDELLSDYREVLDDFSKVAIFKQKWNGVGLTRKERQDGTKTMLINSSRVFEKAEIWCLNFADKYFAFPGSSVRSNMAAYMNLDFEKASRDFKGIYAISSGTIYSTEPSVLRKGGAGYVVERIGKIIFPS